MKYIRIAARFFSLSFILTFITQSAFACGGFFCQLLPIDQAAEQIVFRKDGTQITTMVRISYTGDSENFGWVLPVPNTPELSLGSDITFIELESATRPQFILSQTGEACPNPTDTNNADTSFPEDGGGGDPGVVVEETLAVGPFDAQIISGDDPDAVANWLVDNNFDLSDRGAELIEPYVTAGMKFVVLKLQSNRSAGDIQPIVLKYESEKPMIPIKLTAVAAEDDMGILVWLLGEARAVPENFLHVTPNYTRLNWYVGTRNAYASYQTLVTEAMNEAGGQGFATDYAGNFEGLMENFTQPESFTGFLENISTLSNAEFITQVWFAQQALIVNAFSTLLPLPDGQDIQVYSNPTALATQYTEEQLVAARDEILRLYNEEIIPPLENALAIFNGDYYLTRLYTTLSPEEMLTDPVFVFNPDMPDQQLDRNASLHAECTASGTAWTLTLGEGTGRDDEIVIDGRGQVPFTAPSIEQDAAWKVEQTFEKGNPTINKVSDYATAKAGSFEGRSSSGGGAVSSYFVLFLGLMYLLTFIGRWVRK